MLTRLLKVWRNYYTVLRLSRKLLSRPCHAGNVAVTLSSGVKTSSDICRTLGPELFRKHLFPAISTEILDDNSDDDQLIVPRIPLLNSVTRHIIAETIFFLVKDDQEQYRAILGDLVQLVQYDDTIEDGYRFSKANST